MSAPIPTPGNNRSQSYQPSHTYSSSPQPHETYPSSPRPSSYQQPPNPHLSSSPYQHNQPTQGYQSRPHYSSTASAPSQQYSSSPSNPSHLNPADAHAVIPHPSHQHGGANPTSDSLQPYHQPQYLDRPQHPGYERQGSHQSHRSHHSHHSHHSHQSQEERDRELERRPTFGDTLSLMWNTVVGAVSGKRR